MFSSTQQLKTLSRSWLDNLDNYKFQNAQCSISNSNTHFEIN